MVPTDKPIYLCIVSGKGGVGKSTVAVNLAVALAESGYRVGLVDADIYGFSIPSLMGVRSEPQTQGGKIVPIEAFGVKLMSAGFLRPDNQPVTMRGPMLGRVLRTFLHDSEWGELDYLLFDLPPGTGDIPLDLHDLLGHAKELVITTPHETASEVAFRAGAMTAKTGHEVIGVVENMAYSACEHCGSLHNPFGEHGGMKLAHMLRTDLLAQLPIERRHPEAPAPGIYYSESQCAAVIRQLAEEVVLRTKVEPSKDEYAG